jgi:DNA primase
MDALDLKQHIINNDLIFTVLDGLKCHSIKAYPREFRAGLPNHSNPTAISVKKESLGVKIYSLEKEVKGDIFTLVMQLKDCSFKKAIKFVHEVLNIPYTIFSKPKEEEKKDILQIFKKMTKNQNHYSNQLKIYDEKMLNKYINLPNIWWIREGITPDVQEKFKLGYSPYDHRITIPQRWWCGGENDYIGCKGRTILEDYDLLGVAKYMALTTNFYKTLNIYGLQENYQSIQELGEVIVFEGEKSVLKMATWKYNNAVAILGHELSQEQINILIGLDVDICLAFDKDVKEEFVRESCKKFNRLRRLTYIYDKDDILSNKMSPVDKKKRTFDFLYKHRIKI